MNPPSFLFAPDNTEQRLYIVHTEFPMCVFEVVNSQILLWKTELLDEDEVQEDLPAEELDILAQVLREAADFYRDNIGGLTLSPN